MLERRERPLDYLAVLLAHALLWDGLAWSPGAVDHIYRMTREWGVARAVADVMLVHGHDREVIP